ncbi:MAG: DUF4179 domain-containing protein [Anaerolineales bacterium]
MNDLNPTPEFEEKVRQAMDVPGASPEFVNKLRNELVRGPVKMKSRVMFKPVWAVAFVLALAVLVISVPGVAAALGRLFGYVPDVGLIENTGNLQMLAEPVSVTRDGITLTITQAIAYEDHLELTYKVDGVTETYGNEPDMCGSVHPNNDFWSDADADLRLPDSTIVRRDYAGEFQSVNQFAMKPVYAVRIPADVHELTMVLKCIPFTKVGDVPENWEVPFKLKAVPAGTVVGDPVIEVVQPTATEPAKEPVATAITEVSNVPHPVVTMKLEKLVPMASGTVFYFSMDMENRDPSLISIMPSSVYVIELARAENPADRQLRFPAIRTSCRKFVRVHIAIQACGWCIDRGGGKCRGILRTDVCGTKTGNPGRDVLHVRCGFQSAIRADLGIER